MKAAGRSILLTLVGAACAVVLAGLMWAVLGVLGTTPESAAQSGATNATGRELVSGTFRVLASTTFPSGRVIVYAARARAYGRVPAMDITGEEIVEQRFGHWTATSGGWGGPANASPKNVADVSQDTFLASDGNRYTVLVVRPLSRRARTLNLTYSNGRAAHLMLARPAFVTVTRAQAVCGIRIADATGRVIWPYPAPPPGKQGGPEGCTTR
jgi:hypothetical protein